MINDVVMLLFEISVIQMTSADEVKGDDLALWLRIHPFHNKTLAPRISGFHLLLESELLL